MIKQKNKIGDERFLSKNKKGFERYLSMSKKAAMTMTMLISIIFVIIAIGVFLVLYASINWTGTIDKEICHQSVIYRATLPTFAGAKEYVPLKCKTQKICITSGFGGECDEFENSKGVTRVKVNSETEIEQFLAREILECWTMMGEGKVEIFGDWLAETYGIGRVGSSCVICSRVAFDEEKLNKAGIDLGKLNVLEYMQTHAIPNQDISYYAYLAGEGGEINLKGELNVQESITLEEEDEIENFLINDPEFGVEQENFDALNNFIDELTKEETEEEIEKLNQQADELAIMFSQISAPTEGEVLRNTLKAGAGLLGLGITMNKGAFVTKVLKGPVQTGRLAISSGTKTVLTPFAKVVAAAVVVGLVAQAGQVAYNRAITAGYCGDVSIGEDAREGCSVVRTINYNPEEISQYCSIIESIS